LYSDWNDNNSTFNNINITDHLPGCKYSSEMIPKFPFITLDNIIFICFQLFQLYFCFNAVLNEHIVQIIAINVLNFGWSIYGFVITNVSYELNNFIDCIPPNSPVTVAYLSFELYDQFGWNIYKKLGGDLRIQEHKTGMILFLVLWLAAIADFILVFAVSIYAFKVIGSFWISGSTLVIPKPELNGVPIGKLGQLEHIWNLEYDPDKPIIDT
ncbi:12719_t:CDS:2, partial [Cetraspora pellucida]